MNENALPRQVLQWLQGLDLSYSIKNVKRDFSNGFLFAEIFSRYYESDVNMHSFSNGIGINSKQDNWYQLQKLFKKWGVEISPSTVNEIIHCKSGAVARYLEHVYSILSGRSISKASKPSRAHQIPPFARETASNLIKNRLKQPDFLVISDENMEKLGITQVLEGHNKSILEERSQTRKEITSSLTLSRSRSGESNNGDGLGESKCEGGESKSNFEQNSTTSLSMSASQQLTTSFASGVQVKHVKVKQLNVNVAQLRADRELNGAASLQISSFGNSPKSGGESKEEDKEVSVLELLDEIVLSKVEQSVLRAAQPGVPPAFAFAAMVEQVQSSEGSLALACAVMEDITTTLGDLEHRVAIGHEFWTVTTLFMSMLEAVEEDESELFELVRDSFIQYGQLLLRQAEDEEFPEREKEVLAERFFDLVMPKLLPIISSDTGKRRAALMIFCAFIDTDPDSRMYMIKRIRHVCSNQGAFLQILSILIFMEQNLHPVGPAMALLDLYAYYALIGVSHASPTTRSASLAMLAVIMQQDFHSIPRILPTLATLADDPWWEVKCQLLIVCSKVLEELEHSGGRSEQDESECREWVEDTVMIICEVFNLGAPVKVRKLGLSYLGKQAKQHEVLLEQYVAVLVDLARTSHENRHIAHNEFSVDKILGLQVEPETLPVPSACGGVYHLPPLPSSWDPLVIAAELLRQLEELGEEQAVSPAQAQIMRALVITDSPAVQEQLLHKLKDVVLGLLCDEHCSSFAADTVQVWIQDQGFPLLEDTAFIDCLKNAFKESHGQYQHCLGQMLTSLLNTPDHAEPVRNLVSGLCEQYPELMENPVLSALEQLI